MNEDAKKARAEYLREYKRKNAARINAYNRKWRKAHPEKTKQYIERYWNKKAKAEAE